MRAARFLLLLLAGCSRQTLSFSTVRGELATPTLVLTGALADGSASAQFTAQSRVAVTLANLPVGARQYRLSNNQSFTAAFADLPKGAITWTLADGDGDKTVAAQISDGNDNLLGSPSAQITLDTTPPEWLGAVTLSAANVNQTGLTVLYQGFDNLALPAALEVAFSQDGNVDCRTLTYAPYGTGSASYTLTAPASGTTYAISGCLRDQAGNIALAPRDGWPSARYDTDPPSALVLNAALGLSGRAELSWSDANLDTAQVLVDADTDANFSTPTTVSTVLADCGQAPNALLIDDLQLFRRYSFRVHARDCAGNDGPAQVESALVGWVDRPLPPFLGTQLSMFSGGGVSAALDFRTFQIGTAQLHSGTPVPSYERDLDLRWCKAGSDCTLPQNWPQVLFDSVDTNDANGGDGIATHDAGGAASVFADDGIFYVFESHNFYTYSAATFVGNIPSMSKQIVRACDSRTSDCTSTASWSLDSVATVPTLTEPQTVGRANAHTANVLWFATLSAATNIATVADLTLWNCLLSSDCSVMSNWHKSTFPGVAALSGEIADASSSSQARFAFRDATTNAPTLWQVEPCFGGNCLTQPAPVAVTLDTAAVVQGPTATALGEGAAIAYRLAGASLPVLRTCRSPAACADAARYATLAGPSVDAAGTLTLFSIGDLLSGQSSLVLATAASDLTRDLRANSDDPAAAWQHDLWASNIASAAVTGGEVDVAVFQTRSASTHIIVPTLAPVAGLTAAIGLGSGEIDWSVLPAGDGYRVALDDNPIFTSPDLFSNSYELLSGTHTIGLAAYSSTLGVGVSASPISAAAFAEPVTLAAGADPQLLIDGDSVVALTLSSGDQLVSRLCTGGACDTSAGWTPGSSDSGTWSSLSAASDPARDWSTGAPLGAARALALGPIGSATAIRGCASPLADCDWSSGDMVVFNAPIDRGGLIGDRAMASGVEEPSGINLIACDGTPAIHSLCERAANPQSPPAGESAAFDCASGTHWTAMQALASGGYNQQNGAVMPHPTFGWMALSGLGQPAIKPTQFAITLFACPYYQAALTSDAGCDSLLEANDCSAAPAWTAMSIYAPPLIEVPAAMKLFASTPDFNPTRSAQTITAAAWSENGSWHLSVCRDAVDLHAPQAWSCGREATAWKSLNFEQLGQAVASDLAVINGDVQMLLVEAGRSVLATCLQGRDCEQRQSWQVSTLGITTSVPGQIAASGSLLGAGPGGSLMALSPSGATTFIYGGVFTRP